MITRENGNEVCQARLSFALYAFYVDAADVIDLRTRRYISGMVVTLNRTAIAYKANK